MRTLQCKQIEKNDFFFVDKSMKTPPFKSMEHTLGKLQKYSILAWQLK